MCKEFPVLDLAKREQIFLMRINPLLSEIYIITN